MELVYTGRWWVGCYIWYSEEGTARGHSPPCRLLIAVPNITPHPSTASVPITVLLCNGLLLCGFNVLIKGLSQIICIFASFTSTYWSFNVKIVGLMGLWAIEGLDRSHYTVSRKMSNVWLHGYRLKIYPQIFTIFGTCHQQKFKNQLRV